MATQLVLPCAKTKEKGRIEVRVRRNNPSKKKGTVGKQVPKLKLKLRELGQTGVLATTTSKSGTDCAVFDHNIDPNKQYTVDLYLPNGKLAHKDALVFGPTQKVGKVFSSNYRIAKVEFWVHVYEYRLTLQLGDVDSIFSRAANTRRGRMERLQVLGLLPRPLNHPEVGACFNYVWGTYMKRLVSGSDDPGVQASVTNGAIDSKIKTWLKEFLVEKGKLPTPGQFAKIRVPGDYRVFHRDFDPRYFQEPQFTQFRGNRYDVEQQFLENNPAIGKIPIEVVLERREERTNDPWEAAPDKKLHLQLVPPDTLPAYGGPGGPQELVGANTWSASVSGASLRATAGKALNSNAKANNGGAGPLGYFKRHVTERKGDPNFAKPNKNDPQKDNVWAQLGGKRRMSGDMRDVTTTSGGGDNVFRLTELGHFLEKGEYQTPAAPGDLKADPYSVELQSNDEGKAGVILAGSLIGGDRYRLRGYFGKSKKPRAEILTGTMVRWRTIRIARHLTVQPPADKAGLHATIRAELSPYYSKCGHKESRYCGDCLVREGKVVDFEFSGYLTRELSKAYCELLVDKTAVQPAHKIIDAATLDRALTALQNEQTNGDQQGGIVSYTEPAVVQNGRITGTLKGKGTIIPKTVKLIVEGGGGATVIPLIDDGAGQFTGTGKQVVNQATLDCDGTIAYDSGRYDITINEGIPPGVPVKITYRVQVALDLKSLFYWADKSPFLFNLHTPQAYNDLIDRANFAPIPTEFSVVDADLGTGDGTKITFEKQLPTELVSYKVKLEGGDLPAGFSVSVSNTSKLSVFQIEKTQQQVSFNSGTAKTGTFTTTLPIDPAPDAMMVQVTGVQKAKQGQTGDGKSQTILIVRPTGAVQVTGSDKGTTGAWDPVARKLTIDFPVEGADKYTGFVVEYYKPKALEAGKRLAVDYTGAKVYDSTNPEPAAGGHGVPSGDLDKHVSKMINFYLMIKLIRAIDNDNKGFMPGLLGLQAPLRDTWSSIYDPTGLHQGKGLCNGFFVFYGKRWRDAPADDVNTFNQISLHEMSHCLYLNHFPSGNPFGGGARADLHDMFDNCMMGYGKNEEDLCGVCVAALMGLKTNDPRLGTWSGAAQIPNDMHFTVADNMKHVEPPTPAEPGPVKDGDDIMSLLLNCPVGKQVWDDALDANGGVEPDVTNVGPTGTGMCDIIPANLTFPTVARVEFHSDQERDRLVQAGGELRKNDGGTEFVQFIGDWVGVQIFIMELGNLSKRYDFFDLDYRTQKGEVGLEAYIRGTEKIEYDGGVTSVIQAYRSCKDFWEAPVCQKASSMKDDGSGPLDFDEYYDSLPATHKGKYYGEWHERGQGPFYRKNCPRLQAIADDRVQAVLMLVKNTFGSRDTWKPPQGPMNLFGDDDACWTLLNLMFTLDPDWDIDSQNRVLDWVKTNLALQTDDDAMVRVAALATLSTTAPPDLT